MWSAGSSAADPKKTNDEEVFLSRIKLCTFNFSNSCRYGAQCNFAHSLGQLLLPEERMGNWSEAWLKGDVDMCLWPDYTPNGGSLERFRQQFMWEYQGRNQQGIPNWAWGQAVRFKIITPDNLPPPRDP